MSGQSGQQVQQPRGGKKPRARDVVPQEGQLRRGWTGGECGEDRA